MDAAEIYKLVTQYLVTDFEIDPNKITPKANLFTDLEMDSIDALDWFIKMETELKVKLNEKELKKIRTVQDVVNYAAAHITRRP
ncbi:MAG: acyl carrier protein [Pseudomonadota bacterium]